MSENQHPTKNTLTSLIASIQAVDGALVSQATKAVNLCLTLRNWLIGYYIAEYELNGADRATYGEELIAELAKNLQGVSNCNRRQLYGYLKFYKTYPQLGQAAPAHLEEFLPQGLAERIVPSAEAQLQAVTPKGLAMSGVKVSPARALSVVAPEKLLDHLSFTHFRHLLAIEDSAKRAFYEAECIRGNWSVRELQRQVASLYFERSGLSEDKSALSALANQNVEPAEHTLPIRDPYIFEFLGLTPAEVMSESHLEGQLIGKLEAFLLELGYGFCFEARQKRILIGGEHFFVDLVFYHRILKCHVLVELKLEAFSHENLGQLNTYLNWYQRNMMADGDNPPVGILLCTSKNHALVEYALAGMDNQLFVSRYQVELPTKEVVQAFMDQQIQEAQG